MTISKRLGLSNYPHYGAGTGTTPAFEKIQTWGMSLSNNNDTITYNVITNLQPNITLNYELVGANVGNFQSGNISGSVTLDSNSSFTISETLNVEFDYANVTDATVNLTLYSPVNNATVATAPDLTITQATAPNISGGNISYVTSTGTSPYQLTAEYTLHTITANTTVTIHDPGSNANLELYTLYVGGGSAGASGDSVDAGTGGGAGEVGSSNVTVTEGWGSFASLNPIQSYPNSQTILDVIYSANAVVNGVTLTTDSFLMPANTNLVDGELVNAYDYPTVAVRLPVPQTPSQITIDYNDQDVYVKKNTSASNANVSVWSIYTDENLTNASIKDSGNVWRQTLLTTSATSTYGYGLVRLDPTPTSWDAVIGDGGTVTYQPSPPAYIASGGLATYIGRFRAKPGYGGKSGNGYVAGNDPGGQGSAGGAGAGADGGDAVGNESGTGGNGIQDYILATYDYWGGGGAGGAVGLDRPSGGLGGGGGLGVTSTEGQKGQDGKGGGGMGGPYTLSGITPGYGGGDGAIYIRYMSKYRTLSI